MTDSNGKKLVKGNWYEVTFESDIGERKREGRCQIKNGVCTFIFANGTFIYANDAKTIYPSKQIES